MSVKIGKRNWWYLFWHSDEHNLHPNTPTKHILGNLSQAYNLCDADKMDMEVWGGDLCHRSVHTSDPDYVLLQRWVKDYLYRCHEEKRIVRIIEGTSSHDWTQPKMFELLKPKGSPYIKYIDTLSIEYIDKFDIHVMYVPDNFGKKPKSEVYEDAIKLLAEHNLKQVHFIFLHGAWDFNNPDPLNKHKDSIYDSNQWSQLASLGIFSGHIHKPSHKDNIWSSGSFDRTAFNEMHPKGAYQVYFDKDEMLDPVFYENKNAMIYDGLKITPETTSKEIIKLLDRYLDKLPMKGANIRLYNGKAEVVNPIIKEYQYSHPQYTFSAKNADELGTSSSDVLYEIKDYVKFTITEENLEDNLFRFMDKEFKTRPELDKAFASKLLKELIKNE